MAGRLFKRLAYARDGRALRTLRADIMRRQITGLLHMIPATLVFNLATISLVTLVVWDVRYGAEVRLWAGFAALSVLLLLVPSRVLNPSLSMDPLRFYLGLVGLAGLRALAWGAGIVLFLPMMDPGRQLMLGMTAGVMLGAEVFGLAALPAAAVLYGGVVTVAGSIALVQVGNGPAQGAIMLLIGLFGYLMVLVRHQARILVTQIKSDRQSGEQQQTISILLKDFEVEGSDWLWQTDASGRFVAVSDRFARAAGLSREQLSAMRFAELFAPDSEFFNISPCNRVRQREPLSGAAVSVQVGGVQRYWSITASPQWGRLGRFCGMRGVAQDITGRLLAERRLQHLAHTDQLTGLINRGRFMEFLTEAFATRPASEIGVITLDLTGFKLVNDTLGHPVGDVLLTQLGMRLRNWGGDAFEVARLGGDEFAILLLDIQNPAEAERLAGEVLGLFEAPFDVPPHSLVIDSSIGIAVGGAHGADAGALMQSADLALYAAKADGRGQKRLFEAGMGDNLLRRKQLEQGLRGAVERGELHLHYQPIFEVATGKVTAYEALLRWMSPTLGSIDTREFIPIAEESGLIVPIGDWVLSQAAQDAATWPSHIQVSVNVSPVQLRNTKLLSMLVQNLDRYGLLPSRLIVEITESVLLEPGSHVMHTLHNLLNLGVEIALDDFGTGYSSLSYLRSFPFSKIKIDESFVEGMESNPANVRIIRAIIDVANALGFDVVAEGVETPMQLAELKALNCKYVQGYLFAPPQSASDLIILTDRRGKLIASQF